jgi:hypothetical protein
MWEDLQTAYHLLFADYDFCRYRRILWVSLAKETGITGHA